jgi:hypothetical protein
MNAKQSFVAFCLALSCGALIGGESVLSAQGAVVFACASISTGSVRVVFGGSECKSNESPLQWNVAGQPGPAGPAGPAGPQGEPGEESVVTVGTSSLNTTKTVTIPGLGDVEASCDAAGVPHVIVRTAAGPLFNRQDVTTVNGTTQTTGSFRAGPATFDITTNDREFGVLAHHWITEAGTDGAWKVDAYVKVFRPASGGPIPIAETPCTAAASITIMD